MTADQTAPVPPETDESSKDGARDREPWPGVRMRTVVTGMIAAMIGSTVMIGELTSRTVPFKVLALIVLIVSGVLLLGSGIVSAILEQRQRYRDADPYLKDGASRS